MYIVLGITGSISAYKSADIANSLTKDGHEVHVVMTEAGCRFITPLTMQTLSKNKVHSEAFEEYDPTIVKHINLAENADLVLIAPASADIIGKIAGGIADDLLTSVVMAAANQAKILLAPAMNTNMYENPIVRANMQKLRDLGYGLIDSKESRLACGTFGKGALADVDVIVKTVENALDEKRSNNNKRR